MSPKGDGPIPDQDVLEIGAGTGQLAVEMAEAAQPATWTFTLADTSEGMREVAAERVSQRGWTVLDRDYSDPTTTLDDASYDLVVAQMVLHHVKDLVTLLSSVHAMVKPGGSFIAIDLTEEEGREFHVHHGHDGDVDDPDYYHDGFTETAMRQLCARAGFSEMTWSVPLTIKRERHGRIMEFPLFLLKAQR
ncbi:class I SAM-dependent methyltransferase [Cutibacterium equinum]|uniref:Class I SAM-dependent methyltransferase n=1 Tax=Cutibacterium equinum TaxID=3016342 RepID=A0ABY7QWX2_9ACTN|nr:class I SAM-dependent methyltransferase [Cutibacterium equinum]WCC79175.1 class I SAM-dependent methyltransferase [Cutibacterium equinum]